MKFMSIKLTEYLMNWRKSKRLHVAVEIASKGHRCKSWLHLNIHMSELSSNKFGMTCEFFQIVF